MPQFMYIQKYCLLRSYIKKVESPVMAPFQEIALRFFFSFRLHEMRQGSYAENWLSSRIDEIRVSGKFYNNATMDQHPSDSRANSLHFDSNNRGTLNAFFFSNLSLVLSNLFLGVFYLIIDTLQHSACCLRAYSISLIFPL